MLPPFPGAPTRSDLLPSAPSLHPNESLRNQSGPNTRPAPRLPVLPPLLLPTVPRMADPESRALSCRVLGYAMFSLVVSVNGVAVAELKGLNLGVRNDHGQTEYSFRYQRFAHQAQHPALSLNGTLWQRREDGLERLVAAMLNRVAAALSRGAASRRLLRSLRSLHWSATSIEPGSVTRL